MGTDKKLYKAAAKGDVKAIKKQLEEDWFGRAANPNWHNPAEVDYMPLHAAVFYNSSAEAVSVLLQAGARVDAKIKGGKTSQHLAAGSGRIEVVQVLLQAGANVNRKNEVTVMECPAGGG